MDHKLDKKFEPVHLYSTKEIPEVCDKTLAPIIFIPGFVSTNRTFNMVKNKISRRTKRMVYVVDLRNHGRSGYSDDFTIDHLVADLEHFMDTKVIQRAVLAGHSMGGRLALAMALKHPDRIEKVIVEDITITTTEAAHEEYNKAMLYFKFIHHKLKQLPSNITEEEAQKALLPIVAKYFPTAVNKFPKANSKAQFRLPLVTDSSGKLAWEFNYDAVLKVQTQFHVFDIDLSSNPVYTGKTLILAGENSVTRVQDDLDKFCKHFPNFECEIIEKGHHTYHVEVPELYVKLVSKFVGEDNM